jgi:hypothetical protein
MLISAAPYPGDGKGALPTPIGQLPEGFAFVSSRDSGLIPLTRELIFAMVS